MHGLTLKKHPPLRTSPRQAPHPKKANAATKKDAHAQPGPGKGDLVAAPSAEKGDRLNHTLRGKGKPSLAVGGKVTTTISTGNKRPGFVLG